MSNPYAPPEDRPRPPEDAPRPAGDAAPQDGAGAPPRPPAPAYPDPWLASRPTAPPGPPRTPEPPSEADLRRATVLARTAGLLVVASVICVTLRLPWRVAAIAFAVAALVVTVQALVVAVRGRVRGGLPAILSVLGVLSGMLALSAASAVLPWQAQLDRQECLEQALTVQARATCDAQWQKDLDGVLQRLEDRTQG